MLQVVEDTRENRKKGWRRMVLFGLTFQPSGIKVSSTFDAIKMLKNVEPSMKILGEGAIPFDGGLYPVSSIIIFFIIILIFLLFIFFLFFILI
jgi:hypothetical protein